MPFLCYFWAKVFSQSYFWGFFHLQLNLTVNYHILHLQIITYLEKSSLSKSILTLGESWQDIWRTKWTTLLEVWWKVKRDTRDKLTPIPFEWKVIGEHEDNLKYLKIKERTKTILKYLDPPRWWRSIPLRPSSRIWKTSSRSKVTTSSSHLRALMFEDIFGVCWICKPQN